MKHDKITPDLAALRARAQNANKARSPVRITKARRAPPDDKRKLSSAQEFVPASPRERRDGWTPEKQVDFIEALGECGCVTEACERVGLSASTAYRLRRRNAAFAIAWDASVTERMLRFMDIAQERILNGTVETEYRSGKLAGYRIRPDDRLLTRLLAAPARPSRRRILREFAIVPLRKVTPGQ